ncbi:P-loop containing nucleoside triphosphate hydrolase protein [Jaminaea rosea]|uniref:RNA helicase n=1 Tax=Jaminaea rosea TaxID=1569628 RepID=A0A316UV98_9BASI|nr:P-loop containing nucleoside triphosphate hydrolase protein [Jaminaea rosea]PWN28934.1 P-loop containing nucleoside triphosphate hydrolase protein [Jaminaea rosea]
MTPDTSALAGPSTLPASASSSPSSLPAAQDGEALAFKRRRPVEDDDVPKYSYDDEEDEDDYESKRYVPLKQRKLQELQKVRARGGGTSKAGAGGANTASSSKSNGATVDGNGDGGSAARRDGAKHGNDDGSDDEDAEEDLGVKQKNTRLLDEARALREAKAYATQTEAERQAEEERKILEAHAARRKLASDMELAKGISCTEPLKTSWKAPRFVLERTEEENVKLREQHHVLADGLDIPPLITNFRDMKVPNCLIKHFASKGIKKPTPIQMQGLPTAFSGRDMIGIAFTGSGKTLAFSLPIVMFAVEEQKKLPYTRGEGPLGMIICPSRELARQTYENLKLMAQALAEDGYPEIGVLLCIGGISMAEQHHTMNKGFHIVVATPGRLQDMLEKKKFTLECCKYLCLDEADRMVDMGFEEDVRNIMSFFKQQRQTLLFSATMPAKIQDFAEQSLIAPVVINVGRAGAASLDIVQEVEYVKQEAKMVYLLECLQKTAPPVIIFSENKNEVDDIQEYLLLKGVEAVAIHGSKTQDEREYAIRSFKSGQKDVMVASGVASKGLDFNEIQHVINFTMPKEIESYVHQIGRTGRSGKTGIATTFVNMSVPEQTLLDLKYLLMEAKQRIPPFLAAIEDPRATAGGQIRACAICGGLGHSVQDCPKLEEEQRRKMAGHGRDAGGGGY